MNWHRIETAPKDGTVVKLLIPYNPQLFNEEQRTTVGYWCEIEYYNLKGCWRFNGEDGPYDIQPTHWQPIVK